MTFRELDALDATTPCAHCGVIGSLHPEAVKMADGSFVGHDWLDPEDHLDAHLLEGPDDCLACQAMAEDQWESRFEHGAG